MKSNTVISNGKRERESNMKSNIVSSNENWEICPNRETVESNVVKYEKAANFTGNFL